ncbi:anti-sigma factor [Pseudomonas sp. Lz4W]|uniref:anti-sigma factor family protein n=1 Tax=Pseudomonas sp. Lz4W TaxID=1206777 RepID=UPI0002C03EC2|nr:zf-HC2 domain-containing protein [Pseudomonas sp. Lz4W]AUB76148.1 anti-sigma factor [Pseudomonas sp. Lz4W]
MLTCKQYVARSSDYLDGQLTFRQRLQMRHHVLFCPNCRRFTRQMRLMGTALKTLPEPPPVDLEMTVKRMMREQSGGQ